MLGTSVDILSADTYVLAGWIFAMALVLPVISWRESVAESQHSDRDSSLWLWFPRPWWRLRWWEKAIEAVWRTVMVVLTLVGASAVGLSVLLGPTAIILYAIAA